MKLMYLQEIKFIVLKLQAGLRKIQQQLNARKYYMNCYVKNISTYVFIIYAQFHDVTILILQMSNRCLNVVFH